MGFVKMSSVITFLHEGGPEKYKFVIVKLCTNGSIWYRNRLRIDSFAFHFFRSYFYFLWLLWRSLIFSSKKTFLYWIRVDLHNSTEQYQQSRRGFDLSFRWRCCCTCSARWWTSSRLSNARLIPSPVGNRRERKRYRGIHCRIVQYTDVSVSDPDQRA